MDNQNNIVLEIKEKKQSNVSAAFIMSIIAVVLAVGGGLVWSFFRFIFDFSSFIFNYSGMTTFSKALLLTITPY